MRLDRLHIRSRFKNLDDFRINFDAASEMTVLVGSNGTGKSNLLEALTIIFRDLDLGERPRFAYELHYLCRGRAITVDADPERQKQRGYELTADGKKLTWKAFHDSPRREYLPNFVFGYYSGPGNRMEAHFERHQEIFYRQLLNNNDRPLRHRLHSRARSRRPPDGQARGTLAARVVGRGARHRRRRPGPSPRTVRRPGQRESDQRGRLPDPEALPSGDGHQ